MIYVQFDSGVAVKSLTGDQVHFAHQLLKLNQQINALGDPDPTRAALEQERDAVRAEAEAMRQAQIDGTVQSRSDWDSFERVTEIAAQLSAATGKTFLLTDAGSSTSPRYDVIQAPAVGDKVSYAFNGDSYPDGVITKVNANYRFVWTSTGNKYLRRKQTGTWSRGGWALVSGHRFEQNPSF